MKLVILGKNGQVGQFLTQQAEQFGYDVIALKKEDCDITNIPSIKNILNDIHPSIIINATAYHVPAVCEEFPEKSLEINATALYHLAVYCQEKNIQLITYSTDYVFDGTKNKQYIENDTPNPLQVYGISKYAGEIFVKNYNPRGIIIRTCGVFGGKEGSRAKKGNFILMILKEGKDKKTMEISSEQIISPTYAEDLAYATLMLLQKKPDGGIYHLTNEGYCSWADLAQETAHAANMPLTIIPVDRSGMQGSIRKPRFSALQNTKAKAIGVTLPLWKDAVKRYVNYLLL